MIGRCHPFSRLRRYGRPGVRVIRPVETAPVDIAPAGTAKSSPETLRDSCGYALDLTKQLLTLSTAGIAFVVSLVFADKPGKLSPGTVRASLVLFGLSILFGWLCLMRIIGKVNKEHSYDVYDRAVQGFAVAQMLLFSAAVFSLFSVTCRVASQPPAAPTPTPPTPVSIMQWPSPAPKAVPTP